MHVHHLHHGEDSSANGQTQRALDGRGSTLEVGRVVGRAGASGTRQLASAGGNDAAAAGGRHTSRLGGPGARRRSRGRSRLGSRLAAADGGGDRIGALRAGLRRHGVVDAIRAADGARRNARDADLNPKRVSDMIQMPAGWETLRNSPGQAGT